jgi:hypothetical protein
VKIIVRVLWQPPADVTWRLARTTLTRFLEDRHREDATEEGAWVGNPMSKDNWGSVRFQADGTPALILTLPGHGIPSRPRYTKVDRYTDPALLYSECGFAQEGLHVPRSAVFPVTVTLARSMDLVGLDNRFISFCMWPGQEKRQVFKGFKTIIRLGRRNELTPSSGQRFPSGETETCADIGMTSPNFSSG